MEGNQTTAFAAMDFSICIPSLNISLKLFIQVSAEILNGGFLFPE